MQNSSPVRALHSKSSTPAPEKVVAAKLAQFAQSRREFAYALARRHGADLSPQIAADVERFFDAVQAGEWNKIEESFNKINGGDSSASSSTNRPPEVLYMWPAIIDAFGAAEQVHEWPAQQLLDYGRNVLDSLRPGMVYVGGTDNGRWIPELLNDTSEGERHIILTQNGLADATYLDYVRLQYDDRLSTLSDDDSQAVFKNYIEDAIQRLQHDEEHPNEPKQLRPGEDVQRTDGTIQVSGQVAVMAINEKLLESLVAKNPGLSFAVQESFPLKGTYTDALPLGPLMELHATSADNPFDGARAAESLDYWRSTAQQILSDPDASNSSTALKSYSHDANSAANFLASHNFTAEAEEAYRLGTQLWPGNPETVGNLADLLAQQGRQDEAHQMLEQFNRNYPSEAKELQKLSTLWRLESAGVTQPP